ncbi:VWA domain-containing protein [Candidatus Kuenenbacteria bacterium]|nr:VWA domain-containing protein [Candidatus Kuenenbacteria bacterium]
MTSTSRPDAGTVKSVFADAVDEGTLSLPSKDLLCVSLDDNVLAGCDGIDLDDIEATEVTLVSILIDDSGSMSGLEDAVIDGQNEMLEALTESKQKDSFLIGMWALNKSAPYHSYVPVDDALRLDHSSYVLTGMTPLCDRWCEVLAANVAYAQQLRASGTAVRSIAVMITDSGENDSRKHTEADCRLLAVDLLNSEQFVLAMVGLGQYYDFNGMAKDLGIPEGSVLVAGKTKSEIRKVFQLVSQSVIRASQATVDPSTAQNTFFVQ